MIAMKIGSVLSQMRDEGTGGRARSERRVKIGPGDRVNRVHRGRKVT